MSTRSLCLGAALIGSLLLGSAPSAWAGGKTIATGGLATGTGNTLRCAAVNISGRALPNVRVEIRNTMGAQHGESLCALLEPLTACEWSEASPEDTYVSCHVTSDRGAKSLRATLANETRSTTSDAR